MTGDDMGAPRAAAGKRTARARAGTAWLVALAMLGAAPGAFAQNYQMTALGSFWPTGVDGSGNVVGYDGDGGPPAVWNAGVVTHLSAPAHGTAFANAVNQAGEIAGYLVRSDGTGRAVTWTGGVRAILPTLGGPAGRAYGISSNGCVFGESQTMNGRWHAAAWCNGLPSKLPTFVSASRSVAYAGNAAGTVVGASSFPDRGTFQSQATIWVDGKPRQLLTVGGESVATGINDMGLAVGFGYTASNVSSRALVWTSPSAAPIELAGLAGDSSFAEAVNACGTVVGRSFTVDSQIGQHGVMWNGTQVTDLNVYMDQGLAAQGWFVVDAVGLNDAGWIVGLLENTSVFPNQWQGFLLR